MVLSRRFNGRVRILKQVQYSVEFARAKYAIKINEVFFNFNSFVG